MSSPPRVALVYDRINKWGGAERVLLALHKLYPDAPIYTLVHNPASSKWAIDLAVISSFFNKIPIFRKKHELLAPVSIFGFESFDFDQFDLVISVTSDTAKGIITKPDTLHLCYCLTPTRYLWSGHKEYKNNPSLKQFSHLASLGLDKLKNSLRKVDVVLAQRPDHYIAISKTIQKRVKKYYQRDSDLVYPGIDFNFWSRKSYLVNHKSYYLVVSRLVPYKKVDLVVRAFRNLPYQLKIVGTGSQKLFLRSIAGRNVEFLGKVSDKKLRRLYQNASALIFPQNEDFGLTPLESQAAGIPVIAYKKGGATETIVANQTGLFFSKQDVDSLVKAIEQFQTKKHFFTVKNCQENAYNFTDSLFLRQFSAKVDSLWQQHQKMSM